LVRTEHRAGSDAEKEGVTNLTASAGDGDTNGCCIHKLKLSGEYVFVLLEAQDAV
jgi:hypothetical protein